jgi:nucleoside-diphosphate-sugar epimerase
MRIFLAGATGVIGRPLLTLLVRDGHAVTGTTRSEAKAADIAKAGATPAVVNALDAAALKQAVAAAAPEVVIHQLTDLPDVADPKVMPDALAANARLRIDGTSNLIAAMQTAGVRRMIAQSISFMYAPGPEPHDETAPLLTEGVSARGVLALEAAVTGTPRMDGIVLRYGRLYGPDTWADRPTGTNFVHTDAAAHAALLAVTKGAPGIYNIADDDGGVSIGKARRELGFDPAFRLA